MAAQEKAKAAEAASKVAEAEFSKTKEQVKEEAAAAERQKSAEEAQAEIMAKLSGGMAKAAAAMMPGDASGGVCYDPTGLDKILDRIEADQEDGGIVGVSDDLADLFALMDAAPKSKKKSATPPRAPDKNNRFSALSSPERKPKPPKRGPASRGTPGGPSARSRDYGHADDGSDDDDDWRKARAARKTKA